VSGSRDDAERSALSHLLARAESAAEQPSKPKPKRVPSQAEIDAIVAKYAPTETEQQARLRHEFGLASNERVAVHYDPKSAVQSFGVPVDAPPPPPAPAARPAGAITFAGNVQSFNVPTEPPKRPPLTPAMRLLALAADDDSSKLIGDAP
jgi:hypothetical protein